MKGIEVVPCHLIYVLYSVPSVKPECLKSLNKVFNYPLVFTLLVKENCVFFLYILDAFHCVVGRYKGLPI